MNDAAAHRQNHPLKRRLRWLLIPNRKLPPPVNPALVKHAEERAENAQNRVADRITTFSGSMLFVYIHVLWFGLWIGLGVEKYPFGLLTMIVLPSTAGQIQRPNRWAIRLANVKAPSASYGLSSCST